MRFLIFVFIIYAWTSPAVVDREEETAFLSINNDMKQFVDEHVMIRESPKERLRALIDSIFDKSLLDFKYDDKQTYTASRTFKNRSGNCLSYTAMFIVMARYAGLPASFQEVYDYSNWTRQGNIVVFNRHINAVVEVEGEKKEVDFHFSADKKLRYAKAVSDQRAQAHYYNNIGAEAMIVKHYGQAESLLKKAIQQDETFSPAWANLGLLYQHTGRTGPAEKTYQKAIALDRLNFTAQVNLANLYKKLDEAEKAEKIQQRIRKFLQKNPFYHYRLGQTAFNAADFKMALKHYKRAIRRNSKEPEFYAKMAAAYYKLGNHKAAERYLKKAEKCAGSSRDRKRYHQKLNYLYSHHYH